MSDTRVVNTALQEYFKTLSEQISAARHLKDAVTEVLERRDEATKSGKGNLDEWDVLDQSYICIKLRNAFAEIDTKLEAFRNNVSNACKQKDNSDKYLKKTHNTSEEVLTLILSIVSELHQYHKTVAECIAPIVEYSSYRERYPTKYEMKECSSVPITWKAVNEVNRTLRYGYGLSKEDLAAILSWMHGEDLSESTRKTLNQKVDILVQTYKDRLGNLDTCEVDVPIAFQLYPLVLQDVIKDCCSHVESVAATGQTLPTSKEDLETLIRREIPRVQVQIGDTVYDIASPGKAFENTKQKMVAVRHLVTRTAKSRKIEITKEQQDMFSLKVLATACISVSNASARTAVLIAFGKANLIQVKPSSLKVDDPAHISMNNGSIHIEVPSQWSLVEDHNLLQSLSRDTSNSPVATVDVIYSCILDLKAEFEKKAQSLPVVKILRCSGMSSPKLLDKKEQASKGLRKRLSKATSKLFNRKSLVGMPQKESKDGSPGDDCKSRVAGIDNFGISLQDQDNDDENILVDHFDDDAPVPPPRPRRKARKKRKSESVRKQIRAMEEAKHDPQWFESCKKLEEPVIPEVVSNSLSVASFEELKDVIDLLSGSSTSSLSLNQAIDIDRTNLRMAGSKKEVEQKPEVDIQGKISPSDSGIGSSMSVQSHPSVSSISRLKACDSMTLSMTVGADVISSEKTDASSKKEETKAEVNTGSKISLKDDLIRSDDVDSRIEDAEVEMYNEKLSNSKEYPGDLNDERDEDETPSNGKNNDFVQVQVECSDESSSETESEDSLNIEPDGKLLRGSFEDLSHEMKEEQPVEDKQTGEEHKEENSYEERNNSECDQQSETAIISDQDRHSYDADGSEESEDNNLIQDDESRSRSLNTLRGSSESLYYSAWTLNETDADRSDESVATDRSAAAGQSKVEVTTDSYFASGLNESRLSESADTSEDFQDGNQPDDMLYQHFNPRFSWPVGLGDRLAAIWGENEVPESQGTQSGVSSEIWSSENALPIDKRIELKNLLAGSSYNQISQQQKHGNVALPPNWMQQKRRAGDSFHSATASHEEHWAQMTSRGKEEMRHQEWHHSLPQMAAADRGANLHASLKHMSLSEVQHPSHPPLSPSRGWSSSAHPQQWKQGYPQFQGQNFGRPASLPSQINRTSGAQSPLVPNRPGVEFEKPGFARHTQSSGFAKASASGPVNPATHLLGSQYPNWSRDVNSEPLLTASTRRSVSDYETLLLQQQQQQARMASRMAPQHFKNQTWQ